MSGASATRELCDPCFLNHISCDPYPCTATSTLHSRVTANVFDLFITNHKSTKSFACRLNYHVPTSYIWTNNFDRSLIVHFLYPLSDFGFLGRRPATQTISSLSTSKIPRELSFSRIADHEQPLVAPQLSHFKQVPLRTILNCLHS